MNIELLNPFGQDFPESVGSTLEDCALCARFNSTGRFVAAGRSDGWVTVWDLETKGVLRSLEGHVKAVTNVSWSRNSKYLLSTSRDWNCIVWDLASGDRRETIRFDAPVVGATFHPKNSKLILVTLATHQTFLVDLRSDRVQRFELFDVIPAEPVENGMALGDPSRDSGSSRPKHVSMIVFVLNVLWILRRVYYQAYNDCRTIQPEREEHLCRDIARRHIRIQYTNKTATKSYKGYK